MQAAPLGCRIGVEVTGLDLNRALQFQNGAALANDIRAKMAESGLVLLRGQAKELEGCNQVALSRWFGKPFDLPLRYQHVRSPAKQILRVSNDPEEGKVGVGTAGWHIDGVTYPTPFRFALYHIVHVPQEGSTKFLRLEDLANAFLRHQSEEWDKLWLEVVGSQADAEPVCHPFLFAHPSTQKPSVCLHTGKVRCFVWHKGTNRERATETEETFRLMERIQEEVVALPPESLYSHNWQSGDLIISDNLAVAHLASAESQLAASENGLRVLHRVVTEGEHDLVPLVNGRADANPRL